MSPPTADIRDCGGPQDFKSTKSLMRVSSAESRHAGAMHTSTKQCATRYDEHVKSLILPVTTSLAMLVLSDSGAT